MARVSPPRPRRRRLPPLLRQLLSWAVPGLVVVVTAALVVLSRMPAAQPLGELERPDDKGGKTRQTVRQQPPLEGRYMRPFLIGLVDQEPLVGPPDAQGQ